MTHPTDPHRADTPKTLCRTPNAEGTTNIPAWKFECLRTAILDTIDAAGPSGLKFSELKDAIRPRLQDEDLSALGSLGWHCTTVKLELEVAGEIRRLDGSPQRLVRAH